MKRSPEESDMLDNFGPSKFSGDGFLGTDRRTPQEIVNADAIELERAGMDAAALGRALGVIFDRVRQAMGAPVEIMPGVTACYHESRGVIPSPFRGEGTFEKGEVAVSGLPGFGDVVMTRLSIHLIERHGFFQGRGQRYRIEPAAAILLARASGR
jgi:hypothetical protein